MQFDINTINSKWQSLPFLFAWLGSIATPALARERVQDTATNAVIVAGVGDLCDDTAACVTTANLLISFAPDAVFVAGDNAYDSGTLAQYIAYYDPAWGSVKAITHPVPGNHEYVTPNAQGYFDYFNGVGNQNGSAGDRSQGYYSWNLGDWHFIALNSMSGAAIDTAQLDWLSADLAANSKPCTAAYWHHPLVTVGAHKPGNATMKPLWDQLYAARADLVLVGHDHNYQRYAPMDPNQVAATDGLRQIVIGTGGRALYPISTTHPRLEASDASSFGVLKLTLTANDYIGEFVHTNGVVADSFSGSCHKADRIFVDGFEIP